jgi:predicted Rossmann fold nucleotide-binding protein DprA/Smf involved in DNA uptake
LTTQDVIDELPIHVLKLLQPKETDQNSPSLTKSEEQLIQLLSPEKSIHFDQLLEQTKFAIPDLSAVLLNLEMKGIINQDPGKRFSLRL